MVKPGYRGRRRRRIRLPSGNVKTHYPNRKASSPRCGKCGGTLHGTAKGRPSEVRKYTKSRRRPARPYGGQVCHKCLRNTIIEKSLAL